MKLTGRIIALNVATAVFLSASFYLVADYRVSRGLDSMALDTLSVDAANAQAELKELERKTCEVAVMLASRPDVIQGVAETNSALLAKAGQDAIKQFNLGLVTIAGKEGIVLARGHSARTGDSVLGQTNVKKALAGETASLLEEGTEVKFSLRTGAPVRKGTEIVGTVTAGIDISKDQSFVDFIKSKYHVECTVFAGETRVNTYPDAATDSAFWGPKWTTRRSWTPCCARGRPSKKSTRSPGPATTPCIGRSAEQRTGLSAWFFWARTARFLTRPARAS